MSNISEKGVEICRKKVPQGYFHAGNFLEIELPENAYDLVVSTEVLEHFLYELQDEFVQKIAHHLRPGGYLILTTSNGNFIAAESDAWQPLEQWLTPEQLRALVGRHLEILQTKTMRYKFSINGSIDYIRYFIP